MDYEARQLVIETYRRPYRAPRLSTSTATGYTDTIEKFIGDLARQFTNSPEEAEAALKEMNADIERCCGENRPQPTIEGRLAAGIALRRLIKFLR